MKTKPIYISDLHFEHKKWKSLLEFQREELKSFNKRLEEVVVRWTDQDVLSRVEQYQNKFIRHNEIIDTFLHDIGVEENKLTAYAISHPVAIDHVHFDDHGGMREKVDTQQSMYNELKKEFMRFLTTAM